MPSRFLTFMLAALMIAGGCSKKDSTAPDDGGGGDNGDGYTLEEEATNGAGGGTLEADDFTLTVRPGAFDAGYDLSLHASTTDLPFGDSEVTRVFRIEGLPDDWSDTLDVSIAYEGDLAEGGEIAVGWPTQEPYEEDSTLVTYSFPEASLSDGRLISVIPPVTRSTHVSDRRATSTKAGQNRGVQVAGLDGTKRKTYYRSDLNFRINCSTALTPLLEGWTPPYPTRRAHND